MSNRKHKGSIVVQHQEVAYKGPIPPAEQLLAYEKIEPGLANRIVSMAEGQLAHRQQVELIMVKSNANNSFIGLISATLLGLTGIIGGIVIILYGYDLAGYATVLTALAALVGVFIYGKRSNKQELIEKQKILNQINS